MPLFGIRPNETFPFVPEECNGDEKPPTFHLALSFTREQLEYIQSRSIKTDLTFSPGEDGPDQNATVNVKPVVRDTLRMRFGIKNWDDFAFEDGEAVPFKTDASVNGKMLSMASLNAIPRSVQKQIAKWFEARENEADEDEGN